MSPRTGKAFHSIAILRYPYVMTDHLARCVAEAYEQALPHRGTGRVADYIPALAKVDGRVSPQTIAALTRGIDLEDGPIAADKARLLDAGRDSNLVELTLHSGRNRIVRRMMAAVGHPVIELVRRQFGPLHLGTLPAGRARELTTVERGALLTLSRRDAPTPGDDS